MKGIRFYEEFKTPQDKRKGKSAGTVVAAIVENGVYFTQNHTKEGKPTQTACYECVCAVYARPNSPVCSSGVALEYLSKNCKRIPESKAREIHPKLFEYLDD